MWQRFVLGCLLLAVPSACYAQSRAEKVLPANSQIYFRWDGYKKHWKTYKKTALGKVIQGDAGTFFKKLLRFAETQGRVGLKQALPPQAPVDKVWDEINAALMGFLDHGVVAGVAVSNVQPPKAEAVLVFPNGAGEKKSLLALINRIAQTNPNVPVRVVKKGKRTMTQITEGPVNMVWWAEGKDAVVAIGTETPTQIAKRLGGQGSITNNPLYKEIQSFDEFPTWGAFYFDLPAVGKVVGKLTPGVEKLTNKFGLAQIRGITSHIGFDVPAERSVTFLHLKPGQRKGILKIAPTKTLSLKALPAMPKDLKAFSAGHFDIVALYDVGLDITTEILKLTGQDINVKQEIDTFQQNIGINIRNEILTSLGTTYATYASPSEGLLGLGAVSVVKIKDEKKLKTALNKVMDLVGAQAPGILQVRTTKYRGVTLYLLDIQAGIQITSPTIAMYKGWLVYSNYPQPVQGFILRNSGNLPKWKASKELQTAISKFPKKFSGITISDPRPGVKLFFNLLPPLVAGLNSVAREFSPAGLDEPLPVEIIPHPEQITRYLFPNVSVVVDEGKRIRLDSRTSCPTSF
ncbi:MAG: hypothetical protein ACFCD0_03745 [Gemmataceae bacterium]